MFEINKAVTNLGFKVEGKPLNRKEGPNAKIGLKLEGKGHTNGLLISHYSNQLASYFANESIFSHGLVYLMHQGESDQQLIISIDEMV